MIAHIYEIIEYDDSYLIMCNKESLINIGAKLNHEYIHYQSSDFPKLDVWRILIIKSDIEKWAIKQLDIFTMSNHYITHNFEGNL